MAAVALSGNVLLTGGVVWESGVTIDDSPVATKGIELVGLAPVPVPPPNTGDPCPCIAPIPATASLECMMTPGTHYVGSASGVNKFMTMGSMLLQKDGNAGKTCQPMIAMSAKSPLNPLPVVTEADLAMFVGILNGAGAQKKV